MPAEARQICIDQVRGRSGTYRLRPLSQNPRMMSSSMGQKTYHPCSSSRAVKYYVCRRIETILRSLDRSREAVTAVMRLSAALLLNPRSKRTRLPGQRFMTGAGSTADLLDRVRKKACEWRDCHRLRELEEGCNDRTLCILGHKIGLKRGDVDIVTARQPMRLVVLHQSK